MSDVLRKFEEMANAEGFELVHGSESGGAKSYVGIAVLVKMSDRKYSREHDWEPVEIAADAIRNALQTNSALLDPERPRQLLGYRQQIEDIYAKADVKRIFIEAIPNGYCPRPCCLNKPWFKVTSAIGHIVIGWRKHVLSIDWKDTIVKRKGEEVFPAEDVTRWETGIHAWSLEKAAEYIDILHKVL